MRTARNKGKRKSFNTFFFILIIFEALLLIFVYVYNLARAKEREYNLLDKKRSLLTEEIRILEMRKAKLTSLQELNDFSRERGLVKIKPQEVIVIEKSGEKLKVLKNEKNK